MMLFLQTRRMEAIPLPFLDTNVLFFLLDGGYSCLNDLQSSISTACKTHQVLESLNIYLGVTLDVVLQQP